MWHNYGMARVRISTTVDEQLLQQARHLHEGVQDSVVMDAALRALVHQARDDEIDAAYIAAYEAHPFDEPDEWGDLASFSEAAARA